MYSISRSEKTGWTVVDCVRVEELLRRSNEAQSIYVLVAIGLMAVALFFSRFVAKSITLPIQRLCDSMELIFCIIRWIPLSGWQKVKKTKRLY